MDFFEKIKGILFAPSKTFAALKEDTIGDAWIYFISIALISSIITLLTILFKYNSEGIGFSDIPSMIITSLLFLSSFLVSGVILIVMFIIGAVIKIVVGRKMAIARAIKVMMYGCTPGLLLGFPIFLIGVRDEKLVFIYVMIGIWIWSAVLIIIGLRQSGESTDVL